jgi:putative nucleotidyltransferase-like protein
MSLRVEGHLADYLQDPVDSSSRTGEVSPGDGRLPVASAELWRAVEVLIDRATLQGVLAHKLGPLAAVRWRRLGKPLPKPLADEERAASFAMLSAVPLLRRIRDCCDGPLVLLKGPELTRLYPAKARRFGDIDVLTPDADAVHQALKQSGFDELDELAFDPEEHHHLPPLRWRVIPLNVEVHGMPNWPPRAQPPSLEEILEAAGASGLEIEGLAAPHPLHHALMLAAHAWRHEPLQTLRDLVDIAAISAGQSVDDLDRAANAWGIGRIWRTTRRAADALFFGAPRTMPLRIWARHLEAVRERTVLESHLQRSLQPFWGFPLRVALAQTVDTLHVELAPAEGETWRQKLKRVPRAVRDAGVPVSRRHKSDEQATAIDRSAKN